MTPVLSGELLYGIFYIAGVVSFAAICAYYRRRLNLRWTVCCWLSLTYMFAMIVGARALYALRAGNFDPLALLSINHYLLGGLWGGLAVYFVLAVPGALALASDRRSGMDLTDLSLPIPLILAKFGCLLYGCCYGQTCSWPWAVTFSQSKVAPNDIGLHPTQIYEMLVLVALLVFQKLLPTDRWRGTLLWWFLLVYGVGRSVVEAFRGDATVQAHWIGLSDSQLVLLAAAACALIVLVVINRRCKCKKSLSNESSFTTDVPDRVPADLEL